MVPGSNWLERNLATIGVWMFVGSLFLLVVGMLGEALYWVNTSRETSQWQATLWRTIINVSTPLIYNGVILYIAGRLVAAWKVTIVGFEHAHGENLRVRGPDAQHVVWIGRRYDSIVDAEAAHRALERRFSKREI